LQTPLDLADVLGVLVETGLVSRTEDGLESEPGCSSANRGMLRFRDRRGLRSSAVLPSAEHALEDHLGLSSIGSGRVGVAHEMLFV
jgi:hypothetical protein